MGSGSGSWMTAAHQAAMATAVLLQRRKYAARFLAFVALPSPLCCCVMCLKGLCVQVTPVHPIVHPTGLSGCPRHPHLLHLGDGHPAEWD